MAYKEFFPHGTESVIVKFICNKCKNEVLSEEINVPNPNYEAEKASDSYRDEYGYAICQNCEKEFNVYVSAGFADGYIEILDIKDEDIIEVIENQEEYNEYVDEQFDAILNTSNFIVTFNTEINKLKSLTNIDLNDVDLLKTLQRQILSGTITCLEDYLSTKLINEIFHNDEYFKNFVRTFANIRNRKFGLNELYEKIDQIQDIVKKELLEVVYHDLPKVKRMYKDALNVEFPNFVELMKIIKTRHDIIHRNGKNKEGEEINVSKTSVLSIIKEVENFVNELELTIRNKKQKL